MSERGQTVRKSPGTKWDEGRKGQAGTELSVKTGGHVPQLGSVDSEKAVLGRPINLTEK